MTDLAFKQPRSAGGLIRALNRLAHRLAALRRALGIARRRRRAATGIEFVDPRLLRDAGFDPDGYGSDPQAVRDRHSDISLLLPR